jgi:hypothetical protein
MTQTRRTRRGWVSSWRGVAAMAAVGVVLIGVGAVLFTVGRERTSWFDEHGVEVTGTVIELRTPGRRGFEAFSYRYEYGGRGYGGIAERANQQVRVGGLVDVLVDPDEPSRSVVRGEPGSVGWLRAFQWVCALLGLGVCVEAFRAAWRIRRAR